MKIPTDIEIGWPGGVTEEWCQIVHNAFGRGTSDPGPRFSISLMTETWWTDPDGTRASAYLKGHQKRDEEGRLRRNLSGDFLGVIWTNKPDAMYSVDPNVGMVVTQNTIFWTLENSLQVKEDRMCSWHYLISYLVDYCFRPTKQNKQSK